MQEKLLYDKYHDLFESRITLKNLLSLVSLPPSSLIVVPYFRSEGHKDASNKYFDVNWKSQKFRLWARTLLQPHFPIKTIEKKIDKLNVLVHVRTGGGFDSKKEQLEFPHKFPPQIFYIKALERISCQYGHPPIYAHIMTDDPNPSQIAKQFQKKFYHLPNITFGCRAKENGYDLNVLEDFFSIPAFDCLIRGDSTFAIVASLLGDFKMIICPKEAHVEEEEVVIDSVEIIYS